VTTYVGEKVFRVTFIKHEPLAWALVCCHCIAGKYKKTTPSVATSQRNRSFVNGYLFR